MQTGLLKKIDLLVEMAESTASVDTLRAELKEVENEIDELKDELVSLRESREDKYFKISEKQVDENIKVSLEAKIKKQEKAIKKLQKEIDIVVEEETNLHNRIIDFQNDIRKSKEYIDELNKRLLTIRDASTKEYYENVLKEEREKIKELESNLSDFVIQENKTLDKLNELNIAMEKLNCNLESDKDRLEETKRNLETQNSYIDEELKEQDDKKMQELQKHISNLEKRRLEIITDPAILANDAKEFIIHDEKSNALTKLQELVTIVKSKPYMDIPSSNELTAMLQEEEESATTARDEFASLIDTKNYSSGDTEIIEERISYLNELIKDLEEKIKDAREEINLIDTKKFKDLTFHLAHTMEVYEQLKKELSEYKEIIETENEDKTPKRRAILIAAYERKQKELEDIVKIIDQYKENQKELVNKAYVLENEYIKNYELEIDNHKQEIRRMEYLLENASKAKDVLAIENDKQKLKDLDTAVKNIKHRQKYNQTPNEIYDEIEVQLGTMDITNSLMDEATSYVDSPIVEEPLEPEEVINELPTEETIENYENNSDAEVIEDNPFVIGEYDEPIIEEIPKEDLETSDK